MPDGTFPQTIGFISSIYLRKEPIEMVWNRNGSFKKRKETLGRRMDGWLELPVEPVVIARDLRWAEMQRCVSLISCQSQMRVKPKTFCTFSAFSAILCSSRNAKTPSGAHKNCRCCPTRANFFNGIHCLQPNIISSSSWSAPVLLRGASCFLNKWKYANPDENTSERSF